MLPLLLAACSPTSPSEISRERAIEIARGHASFEPTSVEAESDSRQGRHVWLVTLRRADGSHGGLGQFALVTLDAKTGELITIAIS